MTNIRPTLIVVVGATGSGKTDLSIELARHFHSPIISTDSRQLFKGMAIGTAQPSAEQLAQVEHHFIAQIDPTCDYNCGEYESRAIECLDGLFKQHQYVVAVGGSGLYIKALCEGLDDLPECDEALREQLQSQFREEGLEPLLEELQRLDPVFYDKVDRCNPARVLRAVEVCRQSGRPYAEQRAGSGAQRNFKIIKVGIAMDREELYDRINLRVDIMVEEGLEAEARALYPLRHCNALQTVGYREMFDYFDGKVSREEAIELIKRNSRHYAKRQMTWFRRDTEIEWFDRAQIGAIIAHIESK